MADKTINGVPNTQRVPGWRKREIPLVIVESDPKWSEYYEMFKSRIMDAFDGVAWEGDGNGVKILTINHVGSTSVPGLPAKEIIDIDLVISSVDLSAEESYVPRLEAAGFEFRLREPSWYEHRFFWTPKPISCHLHVWGPLCPEVERHRIFRDWLRTSKEDRELYANIKMESAAVSREKGEDAMEYNTRKEWVIKEILLRAFRSLQLLDGERV
ncbi:hypothetical protein ANO11243_094290 [Dothideomycetidae sp. 11243]|nr:hypothetical protein ANO11243_094290 [fungal sp. No.11243]